MMSRARFSEPLHTVAITGGRDVQATPASLRAFVTWLGFHWTSTVVHGACRRRLNGRDLPCVDFDVSQYLIAETDLAVIPYPALWDRYKDSAGPIRNGKMLVQDRRDWGGPNMDRKVDALVRWPGGSGTRDCCAQAQQLGIPVHSIADIEAWAKATA